MKRALLLAVAVWFVSLPLGTSQVQAAGLCNDVYLPVCAVKKDGTRQTYTNAGCAKVDHAKVLHKDACYGPICALWWDPTCARDPHTGKAKTYSSPCAAENDNAPILALHACPVKP